MIPDPVPLQGSPWPVLPPGIHPASLSEVRDSFGANTWRAQLFAGLLDALTRLKHSGCQTVYLDGSYVTGKPHPADFDACWDPNGVDPRKLDPVFLKFDNGREAQKARFKGEFFPSSMMCLDVGAGFLDFMQRDRFSGHAKGILEISLSTDPLLTGGAQP